MQTEALRPLDEHELVDQARAIGALLEQRVSWVLDPGHELGVIVAVDVHPCRGTPGRALGTQLLDLDQVPERPAGRKTVQGQVHLALVAGVVHHAQGIGAVLLPGPPYPHLGLRPAAKYRSLHAQVVFSIPVDEADGVRGAAVRVAHHEEHEVRQLGVDAHLGVEAQRVEHGRDRVGLDQMALTEGAEQPAAHRADPLVGAEVGAPRRISLVGLEQGLGLAGPDEERIGRGRNPRLDGLRAGGPGERDQGGERAPSFLSAQDP